MLGHHGNVQIVAWVDKLASKPKGKEPDPKETKWRQRAADAIVLHCMHDLLVSLHLLIVRFVCLTCLAVLLTVRVHNHTVP